MSSTFTLGLIGAVAILVVLFEMLRRQRLREKYALIWAVVAVGTVVLAVFPGVLTWAADLLGVQVPSNLLFFAASMLLLVMSVQLSYEIGRLEDRTRTLAEEVALLWMEVGVERGDRPYGDVPPPTVEGPDSRTDPGSLS